MSKQTNNQNNEIISQFKLIIILIGTLGLRKAEEYAYLNKQKKQTNGQQQQQQQQQQQLNTKTNFTVEGRNDTESFKRLTV